MKKALRITIIMIAILFFVAIVITIVNLAIWNYELSKIEIRTSKDYIEIYVDENDIVDSDVMINPSEKYSYLLYIDINIRAQIAKYMEENNYKLASGKQTFVVKNTSFDELTNIFFEFEKIIE